MNTLSFSLQFASAAFGCLGTVLLFSFSYSLEPFEGGVFGSDSINAHNERVRVKNLTKLRVQKIGFAILCLSFLAQFGALFVSTHRP